MKKPLDECTFVIFGATGNLARIKLMPALYHLDEAGLLPDHMKILRVGRREDNREEWLDELRTDISDKARGGLNEAVFSAFISRVDYQQTNLNDAESFQALSDYLTQEHLSSNIAFYFSLPPFLYADVANQLGQTGLLNEDNGWRRIVVEKPFGSDLNSARDLQQQFDKHLVENQIYRIDHYLGKETVQNLQVFRFANLLLEPLWNHNYIDHVQITHAETIGIESRGSYYDEAGALRDMIQSHLLQLLSLVAMEPPVSMKAEDLRDEKVKLLRSITPLTDETVVTDTFRAQYTAGKVGGEGATGYLQEEGIPDGSQTETYAALKLQINNWRWRHVPFYLRTGKRLAEKKSMIAICFRYPPKQFFKTVQFDDLKPNWLLIGIQPDENLRMEITVKKPGLEMETQVMSLNTCINNENKKDAYEGLLLDVIEGDHSLFLRSDEVEQSWKIVDPILRHWEKQKADVSSSITTYRAGSWGPKDAQKLFKKEGQDWRFSLHPDQAEE
ncbi:MAG: glucose-6-phosphate dehydrogenase [Cocleimonas sp.]|nr:glucose-6-phosphate dehydrogenase [Cocleimonas sp.]